MVLDEMSRIVRKVHMIRYWIKILQSKENSIERYINSMLKHDARITKYNMIISLMHIPSAHARNR